MRILSSLFRRRWSLGLLLPACLAAAPIDFKLPAQSAADALLAFSQQAGVEVLFSFGDLRRVPAPAVIGSFEPEDALNRLLKGSGFAARRQSPGKFVVVSIIPPTGSISGRLLQPDGTPAAGVRVSRPGARQSVVTEPDGTFFFASVPPGSHRLAVAAGDFQPLRIEGVEVVAGQPTAVEPRTLQRVEGVTQLDRYVVQGRADGQGFFGRSQTTQAPRTATNNLDLPRTENGALPYTIYDREQILRSGVVSLNEFLKRAVLESDATQAPDQSGVGNSFVASSANLNLRGYGADQTVVLINGRRLPEVMTNVDANQALAPDVNFIPLSLIQQVEVLPVSSAALYSGNAVGGVINIVLRSGADAEVTEVNATYNNTTDGFDAPQSSIAFLHGRSLLGGKLHLRVNASFTAATPPTESELGHRRARPQSTVSPDAALFRATPNVRSANGSPLLAGNSSPVTSAAPGADGTGGLAAFAGRAGLRNFAFFDSPGGLAASPDSLDYPYGRRQRRAAYFGSVLYEPFPWLQLGIDATHARTTVTRGYDVLTAGLALAAGSPFNPFGQEVIVSLNEIAPRLGEYYSQAKLDYTSLVAGLLLKLPADWEVSLDAQYSHNVSKYRGLFGADPERWQQLVDTGVYRPLRDTQVHGPPPEFYDRVLIYYGGPGRFVTLGDYQALDAAARVTNKALRLPTGNGVVNLGGDYRRTQLQPYTEDPRFADGSVAFTPTPYSGRTLQRYSAFGELQAPLLPAGWLPGWLRKVDGDLAVRYIAADNSRETNFAPTFGLKLDFAHGLSFRGSVTTSNRVPTPQMSRPILTGGGGPPGVNLVPIADPRRNESYSVAADEAPNPNLLTEGAVTQTAGLIFQRGKVHRFRAALDFVDTRKTNEVIVLDHQDVLNLEALFPERVSRAPLAPGDPHAVGVVTSVVTGAINVASRHSQNWNLSLDYAWTESFGGMFEIYGRWVHFSKYDRQVFPNSPTVDELDAPDGAVTGLHKHRANFGAGWSNRTWGLGLDGHYYHSRMLPETEWFSQPSRHIKSHWQFDAFAQSDLTRFLPWKHKRYGLRAQVRVNNLLATDFPKYANDAAGAGVQPYGDWRGRTYSLSLTATF